MIDGEKIVIWGTGYIAREFFYGQFYKYDVQYFIDNNAPKNRIHNLKVYYPKDVDLKKYRIIIALADWRSVAKQLEEMGLSYYKNYIPYEFIWKDEIPIIDILGKIADKNERKQAISEWRGRKIAFINGNCQTEIIKMYLKQNQEFSKEYVLLDIPAIHLLSKSEVDLLIQNSYILKEIKLFISQNISINNAFDHRMSNDYFISLMDNNVNYIRIPNMFFDIYFPNGGKEQDPEKEDFARMMYPYNDAIIDELANKKGFDGEGYTAEEIIQIVCMENFFSKEFMGWLTQYRLEQLKEREKSCDIKMMDYIENNYLKEQLFYSRNHPINKVLKEEAIRILKYINSEWDTDIEHEETIRANFGNQEFVYPSIHHNLQLDFIKKWYSDSVSANRYTINEEIRKYLFCHNKYRNDL